MFFFTIRSSVKNSDTLIHADIFSFGNDKINYNFLIFLRMNNATPHTVSLKVHEKNFHENKSHYLQSEIGFKVWEQNIN